MLRHFRKPLIVVAVAASAIIHAAPARAGAADVWLHLEGVKGESSARSMPGKGPGKWYEVLSLRSVESRASAQATGKRSHQPFVMRDPYTSTQHASADRTKLTTDADSETATLLLPAVQKVREAAMRMRPLEGCRVGQRVPGVWIRQNSSGRTYRVLDATIAACATDGMSLNFTRLKE